MKIGTNMTELELSHVYSYAELNSLGYSSNTLTNLTRMNKLTRIQRGFYALKNEDILYSTIQLFPEGIICLESALYYYGYIKNKPEILTIAVDKSHNRNKYKHHGLAIKAYFRDDKYIKLGCISLNYLGLNFFIYDKERTICDCIRRKELISERSYKTAIKSYINDKDKDLNRLRKYAKELRIEKKVEFLIESVM